MAVGDSSPATSPGFSQDSLNFEPLESAESLALGALEPPAHLSRLLASRTLEQVLERSHQLPVPPNSLSQHCHSPELPPESEMPHSEARGREATEAESDPEDGLEQAEVVSASSQGWGGDGLPLTSPTPRPSLVLPGTLSQAGILCVCVCVTQSCPTLCDPHELQEETTLAPAARQAPLSLGFSRREYWSGLPFPSPGDLPNAGIKPESPMFQGDFLPSEPPGKPGQGIPCL